MRILIAEDERYLKRILSSRISIAILGALTGCGSKDIGKDKATEIALEDAGLAQTDVTSLRVSKDRDDGRNQTEEIKQALYWVPGSTEQDLRIELEYDDGYYKYEGDIIYNQIEFEIDANTGAFLEWSEERR